MTEPRNFYQIVDEICAVDPRYKRDAYEFIVQALHFTQKRLSRPGHVMGLELLEGIRHFAIDQYGPMAKTVLNYWGINTTDDFGSIVFAMIEHKIFSKTDEDSLGDFKGAYDFDAVFGNVLRDCAISDQE